MLNKNSNYFKLILTFLLRISAFCIFFGRGWEHLTSDAPFRVIFWDQNLMEGLVTTITGLSWEVYATSNYSNFIIDASIKLCGLFYLLCAVVVLFIQAKQKQLGKLLIAGSTCLILLSLLFYKSKFFQFGQFIEYSCQMFSPLFLYLIIFYKVGLNKFNLLLKIAIALTFTGHGLYALGIHITPGIWIDMAMSSLNFIGLYPTVNQVENIIYIAGILDIILAIGIFLPNKLSTPFLIWAFIWGLLTALSRVIGFMHIDANWNTLIQWLPQTILRLPHAFIPLAALTILFKDSLLQKFSQKKLEVFKQTYHLNIAVNLTETK